jgi:hypothetical protein
MAVYVGAVRGRFIIDDSDFEEASKRSIKTSKKVEKSFGGMTSSLFTAQLAFDAFKKVVQVASQVIQKGINSAISYQETLNKFKVVFGDGNKAIDSANQALKNLTRNYGLTKKSATEMLSSTGDLLTGLGFTKEEAIGLSEQVQTLAVDLTSFQNVEGGASRASEALTKAILGETEMAKSLGIVVRQNTKEFKAQVRQLVETKGMTETQAKAQLILSQAYAQSQNAIGDYAATQNSLANMQKRLKDVTDDNIMQIGSVFLPTVQRITRAFLDASIATNNFLNNQKNINSMMAGIETFGAIVKDLAISGFEKLKDTLSPLTILFGKSEKKIGFLNKAFTVLSYIVNGVSAYININLKIWKLLITLWVDVIRSAKNVGEAMGVIIQAIISGDWDSVPGKMAKIGDSFKSMGMEIIDVGKEIGQTSVNSMNKLVNESGQGLDKLKKLYNDKYAEITNVVTNETDKRNKTEIEKEQQNLETKKSLLEQYRELYKKQNGEQLKNRVDHLNKLRDAAIKAGEDEKKATKTTREEIVKLYQAAFQKIAASISYFLNQISSAYQSISEVVGMFYEQDYNNLVAANEAKLEELQTQKENELSLVQTDYEAKLAELQLQRESQLLTEEEYNARKAILDEEKANKEAATTAMMDEKISKQKKKNKEKENKEKKRQFEANKANQIAQAWINFAIGAIAAYVGAFQALGWMPVVGPALAIAMGTVMTGLLLGTTIAQTIAISQQKFTPEKYMGGRVDAGTTYSVNERGQEIFTPGVTGYISPASVTDRIVENVQNESQGKTVNYNVSFRGANITDRISLKKATDYVLNKLQTDLERAG